MSYFLTLNQMVNSNLNVIFFFNFKTNGKFKPEDHIFFNFKPNDKFKPKGHIFF